MILKLLGAVLVVFGSYVVGCRVSRNKKKTAFILQQYIAALEQISGELQYRRISLISVCQRVNTDSEVVNQFFRNLYDEMEGQISPDVCCCADAAIQQTKGIPDELKEYIRNMAITMGRFDLNGQLKGLALLGEECRAIHKQLTDNQDVRLRNNRTFGLCAGIAIVILLF